MRALVLAMTSSLSFFACVAPPPPVMAPQSARAAASPLLVEVAHAEPPLGHRTLLVAYPRTPCAGSARTVLMDESGKYFAAVAPGEATLLTLPERTRMLIAVSSVEIYAPKGTRYVFEEVDVPAAPGAILLEGLRGDARSCRTSGHYASATSVSKREIEDRLAEAEIAWMEPRPREGQAWLDAHRPRLDEILTSRR
jgi:hypothetical protein